jgi:pimeloyl-ACP methyl ester carboxylesterase
MGIRLIAYDRPGYGLSDRHVGRKVADAAADVAALADTLGIDRFAVVGRSGGGPHALACAALLPGRVTSAASLVGLAPRHADGLNWFAGMGEGNVRNYTTAWRATDEGDAGEDGELASSADLAGRLALFTDSLIDRRFIYTVIREQVPEVDRQILADPGIGLSLTENFLQAVADARNLAIVPDEAGAVPGGERSVLVGWLDDMLAFSREWGFDPREIAVPVLLWHGEHDVFSPVDHTRWLARRIPDSTLVIEPGSAHFGALVVMASVLQWLRRYTRSTA